MTAVRVLAAPLLLLAGAATAVAAVAVHTLWWGLPLVAAGVGSALVAVGRGWLTRLPLALGFVAGVGVAAWTRPEGDFAIMVGLPGSLLLLLALLVLLFALVTLPPPRRAGESATGGRPT